MDNAIAAPVTHIECRGPLSDEEAIANVRASMARGLPRFLDRPDISAKRDHPIALVGGGPSLARTLGELRSFETVIACGSSHDYLIEQGIIPQLCVICAPVLLTLRDVRWARPDVDYAVSSHCPPEIFDGLAGFPVALWHMLGEIPEAAYCGEPSMGYGCTVTLRAISHALCLGFSDLHFFGMDSCYFDDASHAYDPGMEFIGQQKITLMGQGPREWHTCTAYIAQALQFFKVVEAYRHAFRPTVHGNGMIAAMMLGEYMSEAA